MKIKEEITCKVFGTAFLLPLVIVIIFKGIIIAIRTIFNIAVVIINTLVIWQLMKLRLGLSDLSKAMGQ